ncbi:multidrug effflux MFS transporter [Marinicella meishanensis]|uniref:multidrug effflux MFS transporter n=1 Tax=Marinicella meishanensis TaxID=2873263 RepID=UPI001CC14CBD|nr:multidrug effflux MFS transporter [Marinicella sp. NBU2979]
MPKQPHIGLGELITLLAMMTSLGALTIDLQLPAMPLIAEYYGLQVANHQQWIITAYMLGFAAAQLFYGPVSDSIGRKPVLMFGVGLYVLASILCLFADNYTLFLLARALQGAGAAAARIMVNAITRDHFAGNEMARVTSLVMMMFIMVPVFAPTLGSLLLLVGPWQWILYAYLLFGCLIVLWSGFRLPESLPAERRKPLKMATHWAAFVRVIKQPLSMTFAVISGIIFSGFMAYLNSAQQLFDQVYGVAEYFPMIFGGIALFFGLAAYANAKVVMHFGAFRVTQVALTLMLICNTLGLILCWLYAGIPPLWVLMLLLGSINISIGLAYGNLIAIAMWPLGDDAGMGASVIGVVSALIAASLGIGISLQLSATVMPVMIGFFSTSLLAFIMLQLSRRHVPKAASE